MTYLVNDMLDLSQINSGILRKCITRFNLWDAISEIVNIQLMKAEFCGVSLKLVMKNFEDEVFNISSDM